MDTRHKIVSPDRLYELASHGSWVAVAGTFDPLTAEQAQRLASRAGQHSRLAVIVESAAYASLLTPEARLILVAALRCVDAAAVMEDAPAFLGEVPVERDPDGEEARSQAFTALVVKGLNGASG